mmetsp:Transcript_65686/g.189398  ORF Transcript_65686/g.189398 Transcript_65686/m.189398 type:complete len:115 (-) Transcript_65686:34-378(-)
MSWPFLPQRSIFQQEENYRRMLLLALGPPPQQDNDRFGEAGLDYVWIARNSFRRKICLGHHHRSCRKTKKIIWPPITFPIMNSKNNYIRLCKMWKKDSIKSNMIPKKVFQKTLG